MAEAIKSGESLTGKVDLYKNVIFLDRETGSFLDLDGKRVVVTVVAVVDGEYGTTSTAGEEQKAKS